MRCRFCNNELTHCFIDLNNAPPSNSFLKEEHINLPEIYYPLKIYVCENCFLVQIDEYKKSSEIFSDEYVYFSSYSSTWLEHCEKYSELIIDRLKLNDSSLVVEIASNDGYLLQYFKKKNINVLGIEPTKSTAASAKKKGIETIVKFFEENLANELLNKGKQADLIVGNNVFAHTPDIIGFVKGLKLLLKKNGVITLEFPHLMKLIEYNQFDTIYHEHFSYFSFFTVSQILEKFRLQIFDVDELSTHGGSLRIYIKHTFDNTKPISDNVFKIRENELFSKINDLQFYINFQKKAQKVKLDFLKFLIKVKAQSKKIAGYAAAAKGNTLLNYCGIKNDLIDFIVDKSPHKQGLFTPGSHIPVVNEKTLQTAQPDYIIILAWNIKDEIIEQLKYTKEWGAKFVIPIPELKIFD